MLESISEIRVLVIAAVARPPTRVHGKLHQIGEPSDLPSAGRVTAGQSTKLIQIDAIGPFRSQIGVKERGVGNLIVGVIMDILVHVPIQHFDGVRIGWVPGSAWNFAVLDSSELVILLPQIGFDEFCCRQESKNVRVSHREGGLLRPRRGDISQQSRADGACSNSK